jgi:hypothetical protein
VDISFRTLGTWIVRELVYQMVRGEMAARHVLLSREQFTKRKFIAVADCDDLVYMALAHGQVALLSMEPSRGNGSAVAPFFKPRPQG